MNDLVSGSESPEEIVRRAELLRLVAAVSHVLTPRQRRLIALRYIQDRTFTSIAAEFGTGQPAIHAMHARAIVRMRAALSARNINFLREVL